MRIARRLASLWSTLFHRDALERELDEEIRASVETLTDRYVSEGMNQEAARRAAIVHMGGTVGILRAKEGVREGRVGAGWESVLLEVRYAWRGFRRSPSFAAVAVLTLAFGIGVNTAVFSVFYAVLMRPLPYDHPEQLVRVWATHKATGASRRPLSAPIIKEIEQRSTSFAGIAGIWHTPPLIVTGDNPEQIRRARVTANFFDVLGVRAAHGRTFVKSEAGGPSVVMTDSYFRRRFAADEGVIGQSVRIQETKTLVGVLPSGFQLYFAPDANVPPDVQVFDTWGQNAPTPELDTRAASNVRAVARLKPDVSIAAARSQLDRVAADLRAAYTDLNVRDFRLHVEGVHADAFGDAQPALAALFAGAVFVLLICSVNVTSMLLTRASNRRGEIALRLALGASRRRVFGQLLAEAGVLCVLGAAVGIAAGWTGFRGLFAMRPERFAHVGDAGLMGPVLALTATASLAATVLFAVAPVFQSLRLNHADALRGVERGVLGRRGRRAGNALVVAEIALGFLLVTGAALAARTVFRLMEVRPGFEPRQLLAFQLPRSGGVTEIESQLASLPGVDRVGAISHLPLDADITWFGPYHPEGADTGQASSFIADNRAVTPGYFTAMQTRLSEGRFFAPQDRDGAQMVVIVDESLARQAWPGQSAVGKRIDAEHVTSNGFELVPSIVVGVVEHINNHSLSTVVRSQVYSPFDQNQRGNFPATFVVRATVPPLSLVPAIREHIRARIPNAAIDKVRLMTDYIEREIAPHSFTAILAVIFGGVALLLAATGIYGVLDYQVSRRRREMGIRIAMGAIPRDAVALVLREGLVLTALGLLVGAGATVVVARWFQALVYGVSVYDPLSYALGFVLLPAAASLGCWRPARRAAYADPADAIRQE